MPLGKMTTHIFFFFFRAYIQLKSAYIQFSGIMVDQPLNEQHEWGGNRFHATSHLDTGGQSLLAS